MTLKVCYFGAYDPEYPRNRVIRQGLAANGVEVVACNVPQSLRTWQRVPCLVCRFLKIGRRCDVILVAEFGQSLALVAWLLSRLYRKLLVFDAFTSLYDTAVNDRAKIAAGSPYARYYHTLDSLSMGLADVVLVDTEQNRQYYAREFSVALDKIHVVYVGIDETQFFPRSLDKDGERFLIQFYGSYIPLHGIEYIISAAKLLTRESGLEFELIGRGQTFEEMQALVCHLGVNNLRFVEPVPYMSLPEAIARADLSLGIFGNTDKARRVIPNKVFQTLAMGKPVLTGDSLAIREVFVPGKHLCTCRMADSEALAEAICLLVENSALRNAVAREGYEFVRERFSPRVLGAVVKEVILGAQSGAGRRHR
jgi:glycosyltransferase involved in cell wall biosynthesis